MKRQNKRQHKYTHMRKETTHSIWYCIWIFNNTHLTEQHKTYNIVGICIQYTYICNRMHFPKELQMRTDGIPYRLAEWCTRIVFSNLGQIHSYKHRHIHIYNTDGRLGDTNSTHINTLYYTVDVFGNILICLSYSI